MARNKIRHYDSTELVAIKIQRYFDSHKEVIDHLLKEVRMNNLDEVWEFENRHCGWYGDCGFVRVKTFSEDQRKEWVLDNGKYNDMVYGIRCPYDSQSTTLKDIQIRKALKDLNMDNQYYTDIRLD